MDEEEYSYAVCSQPYSFVQTGDIISLKKLQLSSSQQSSSGDLEASQYTLVRTPSTYTYGNNLVTVIDEKTTYIVCNGSISRGFCLALHDDISKPIGFGLFYDENNDPYVRITQVGFEAIPVHIRIHGKYIDPPKDKSFIGSTVVLSTLNPFNPTS